MQPVRLILLLILAIILLTAHNALAGEDQRYAVTITNLARGQIVVQPVVISHNKDFQLLSPGSPVAPLLNALAAEGDAAPLLVYAASLPSVYEATASSRVLIPDASVMLEINANSDFQLISAAGMMANMKNTLFVVQGEITPERGEKIIEAKIYYSGQEAGPGDSHDIPGSRNESGGIYKRPGPKKFILINAAGQESGNGSDPVVPGRRAPVVKITIRPIN
ncbi:MAG: spondin domain-containing protein [Nitrospirae bacterium]|nr:spondin domain-containing protein [Nitrospirota bacterium]MCL5237560.1 spondin domain-containing protein [Nitrospirota bacterium]